MRFLAFLLLCACSPCLADPYIQADLRGTWGQSTFEGSPSVTATIGKPAALAIDTPGGIKLETTIVIRELKDGVASVTVKMRLTPPGQAVTSTEVSGVTKVGQSSHVEIRLDDTRSLSLDFTILNQRPQE